MVHFSAIAMVSQREGGTLFGHHPGHFSIDKHTEARYVLQCASVIGRLFRYRLLQHISRQEQDLDRYLAEFEEKELVYEERTVPELEYAFKHAFTQEATYEGILERSRREFHHLVASGIERLYHEHLEEYYEELAHHYSRSGDAEKAVEYLLKAGEKAKRSYLNEVAISHFQQALDMMEQHRIVRRDWEIEALREMGNIYHKLLGEPAKAIVMFERAISLARNAQLPVRQIVRLYYYIADALAWANRGEEILGYAENGLDALGDDDQCLEAALMNTYAGGGHESEGDIEKLRRYISKNMMFINNVEYSDELESSYVYIILLLGYYDSKPKAALEWARIFEDRAREHNDLRSLASGWMYQGGLYRLMGDYKTDSALLQKSLDMNQRIGSKGGASRSYNALAINLLCLGDIEGAEKNAQMFLSMAIQIGNLWDIARAHIRMGNITMCRQRWEEALIHYQESDKIREESKETLPGLSGLPLYLGRAYLKKGDYQCAIQCFEKVNTFDALAGMEQAYMALGVPGKFSGFCRSSDKWRDDKRQLYLEPAEPSGNFAQPIYANGFIDETLDPSWVWVDEFGDCCYRTAGSGGLEICAVNGRDIYHLNFSAPRFMKDISGDFAVEVCVLPVSDDKPQQGGLLVWKDKDNFLRFERGVHGQHEMRLHGYANGKWQIAGRGLLRAEDNEEVHLRLERSGDEFSAYCSPDGEDWFTCGKMTLPMDYPIQVGIHAIGMIDRTIYCGAYKEGTVTVFRNFSIWTRD